MTANIATIYTLYQGRLKILNSQYASKLITNDEYKMKLGELSMKMIKIATDMNSKTDLYFSKNKDTSLNNSEMSIVI
jgi:hypothetical protein